MRTCEKKTQKVTSLLGLAVSLLLLTVGLANGSENDPERYIDPPSLLAIGLASKGAVKKTKSEPIYERRCTVECGGKHDANCREFDCKKIRIGYRKEVRLEPLKPKAVVLEKVGEVFFGEPFHQSLPDRLYREVSMIRNCTSTLNPQNITLSKTLSLARAVTVSRAVATGKAVTVGATVSYASGPLGGIGGNATVSAQFSRQVTVTNATGTTESEQITRSVNQTVNPAPRKEIIAELRVLERSVSIPFSSPLTFDGEVDDNDLGIKKISEVLPESERTFSAEGVIAFTAASDGEVVLEETEAKCDQGRGLEIFGQGQLPPEGAPEPVLPMLQR